MDQNEQLRNAAKLGSRRGIEQALTAGASVDSSEWAGVTALQWAAESGSADCVEALAARGATIDLPSTSGWAPVHRAAGNGHAGVVRALIRLGAELDVRDAFGATAIDHAVACGSAECVRELLAGGADPHVCLSVDELELHPRRGRRPAGAAARVLHEWLSARTDLQERARCDLLDATRFDEAALADVVLSYLLPGHLMHRRNR